MRDQLRIRTISHSPVAEPPPAQGKPPSGRHPPVTLLVGALAAGLLAATATWAFVRSHDQPPSAPLGVTQEAIGSKRVPLADYPDRKWLSFYKANRQMLGEPIWSERPYGVSASCVGFTNYVVCLNSDAQAKSTSWEYLPVLLGSKNLPPGVLEQLDAPLDPLVQQYIEQMQAAGVDWFYWLGKSASPAYCPQDSGNCFQAFQRQILVWPRGSRSAADVRLTPLGLEKAKS